MEDHTAIELTEGINVLSLFNGMSTGHTALDNLGIKVNKYSDNN